MLPCTHLDRGHLAHELIPQLRSHAVLGGHGQPELADSESVHGDVQLAVPLGPHGGLRSVRRGECA